MLDADDVRAAVPMPAAVDAVREAFLDLAAGRFEVPQRLSFDGGTTLVMSACHTPTGRTAVKTLSLVAGRDPMILGTLVWNTPEAQLVADAIAVTTLRTGAVSGVATDLLAPPDASRLAVLGTGAQAADQIRAVAAVRPLRQVTVFGRSRLRATQFADRLSEEFPGVRVAASVEDAVSDAEIVCCATSSATPLFDVDALPERVHVNAIGSYLPSMRELPAELLATAGCVVVDQIDAVLEEAGEVIHAVDNGLLSRDSLVELGKALQEPPVVGGRTVFKSVGVAVQDWAIARLLGEKGHAEPGSLSVLVTERRAITAAKRRNLGLEAFDRSPHPGISAACLLGEPPLDGTRPCGSSRRSARSSRGSKFFT